MLLVEASVGACERVRVCAAVDHQLLTSNSAQVVWVERASLVLPAGSTSMTQAGENVSKHSLQHGCLGLTGLHGVG